MDKGYPMKFIQLHSETLSANEANQNCMFIYWHLMMLLSYENMLRSLGVKYKCITLPYWDHLAAAARRTNKNCSDLYSYSPIIADSGGTTKGSFTNLTIYHTTITQASGLCINQGPLSHFCGNNTVCAQCVIRKQTSSAYPNEAAFASRVRLHRGCVCIEAAFASVYQHVFSYNVSSYFSSAFERGVHSTVMSSLGGVMAYPQSPADPIFYSHYAFLDLLQTIYLKCQNRAEGVFLSATAKNSDPRFWNACPRNGNGTAMHKSSDNITMRVLAYDGKNYVNVWQNPNNTLYPFFKDLHFKYTDLVDAKDLGNYSYTYAISGGLANIYTSCWALNTTNTTTFVTETNGSQMSEHGKNDEHHPVIEPGTFDDDIVKHWSNALSEVARSVGYEDWAVREQLEMITCQYQGDCLGGVTDFSDLYRINFGIEGHTRCFPIIDGLTAGKRIIGIPKWKEITTAMPEVREADMVNRQSSPALRGLRLTR